MAVQCSWLTEILNCVTKCGDETIVCTVKLDIDRQVQFIQNCFFSFAHLVSYITVTELLIAVSSSKNDCNSCQAHVTKNTLLKLVTFSYISS